MFSLSHAFVCISLLLSVSKYLYSIFIFRVFKKGLIFLHPCYLKKIQSLHTYHGDWEEV